MTEAIGILWYLAFLVVGGYAGFWLRGASEEVERVKAWEQGYWTARTARSEHVDPEAARKEVADG